ncbi:unnamed protein product [Adineta ricciae]|uniref:BK channel n=1 Tax=Adineta ricciae TaxID=249248 RepID=A0A814D420_ADIRI|nr:unnamed protein product [Adineta ricciae]CAF1423655.1 unnamed protein product [Adineta ricciae]
MGNCPTCSVETSNINLDPLCNGQRVWPLFLFSSCVVLCSGWMTIFIFDLVKKVCDICRRKGLSSKIESRKRRVVDDDDMSIQESNWLNDMKDWGNSFISGQTKMGKTFVIIIFFCNIASLVLYCMDTKRNSYVESCTNFSQSLSMKIDLGLNSVFLIHFILRLAAAPDKRRCWFSLHSLVDIFTIPPSFMTVYLDRSWIGLRFLRVVPLKDIPNLLQYMHVIERPRTIRIVQLASKFTAILFATAGAVHLAENSGDFFCNFCNAQEISIFNALYYMIITMTTVGYGDISCKTYLGKTFVLLTLIGGLASAVFTTMIPEFANLFSSKHPYTGRYLRVKGKRHVIICGHITPYSLAPFLRDFLHQGRDEVDDLDVIIMDMKTPDLEMEALLKRYYTKLHYFIGSIMNVTDLQRIQVDKAAACLIIVNKECADPNSDDSANIMRVISLKNFNHRIRILLQLLRYINKLNVVSIPGWSVYNDEIICISELKLGLIGMSCVAPGFATMMTNIFRMSSYNIRTREQKTQGWPWRDLYYRGAGMKLYLEEMPPSFHGRSFAESVLICFHLRVMLLAVEMERTDENGNTRMVVGLIPCDDCVIRRGSRAFLVCLSNEEANRVKYYCSICYPKLDDLTDDQLQRMRKCVHMREINKEQDPEISVVGESYSCRTNDHSVVEITDAELSRPLIEHIQKPCRNCCKKLPKEDVSSFDSTGMFYYTSPRSLDDATLSTDALRMYRTTDREGSSPPKHPLCFRDHIIVCLHADQSSAGIGLRNFVLPLRASSFQRDELPTIIFVTNRSYIESEWDTLSTFPDIYILDGSPNNPYNLKLISIHDCRQCVIISTLDRGNLDTYLVDKSSILCALTIRQIQLKKVGLLSQHSLLGMNKLSQHKTGSKLLRQNWIHTLTTLTIDSNVQYVEQGHTDEVNLQFFLTTPFASGTAFADSVLDCMLSCAYYNVNSVNLLRNVLAGGIDLQLEDILAEGKLFTSCESTHVLGKRKRARISLVAIRQLIADIDTNTETITFSSMFCHSLRHHRVVVMGIYRLLDVLLQNDPTWKGDRSINEQKRIVIYFPPYNYEMDRTDMVYIMCHSHIEND